VLSRSKAVSTKLYEDDDVRFEYPSDWELQVTEDGPVTTVALEEYPELDSVPAEEMLEEHCATGYEVEFVSLDFSNIASIRCFRTLQRTVLVFGQWSVLVEDEMAELVVSVLRSIEMAEG
jgi:hypothetical protein